MGTACTRNGVISRMHCIKKDALVMGLKQEISESTNKNPLTLPCGVN
jgi:hypothetical protein